MKRTRTLLNPKTKIAPTSELRAVMSCHAESSGAYRIASELLQRRREVRRLRAVLRFLHERSRECDWYAVSQELTRQAALKPQRGAK